MLIGQRGTRGSYIETGPARRNLGRRVHCRIGLAPSGAVQQLFWNQRSAARLPRLADSNNGCFRIAI